MSRGANPLKLKTEKWWRMYKTIYFRRCLRLRDRKKLSARMEMWWFRSLRTFLLLNISRCRIWRVLLKVFRRVREVAWRFTQKSHRLVVRQQRVIDRLRANSARWTRQLVLWTMRVHTWIQTYFRETSTEHDQGLWLIWVSGGTTKWAMRSTKRAEMDFRLWVCSTQDGKGKSRCHFRSRR